MPITGNQIRAARALIGIDQQTLADRARIGINTVRNMEASGEQRIRVRTDTIDAVTDALTALGVVIVDEGPNTAGAGVRLLKAADAPTAEKDSGPPASP